MFRRWPFFQRLLSWTKPHAPVPRGTPGLRALRLEQPAQRRPGLPGDPARPDGRDLLLPVAAGDGGEPRVVRGAGRASPSATAAAGPRRAGSRRPTATASSSRRPTASTAAGRWSSRSAWPSRTPRPGSGWSTPTTTPTSGRSSRTPTSACCIIGKQNSGFELATGLLPWARQIVLVVAVDGAGCRSTRRRSSASGPATSSRSRTTCSAAGSASSTPRSTGSSAAADGRLTVVPPTDRRRRGPGHRGRRRHLRDRLRHARCSTCPTSASATFGASRLPVQTPWWESASVPGIFFAGTIGQGAKGLQKHGVPSNSGAVHGARYNARVLAGRIAADAVRDRARAAAPRARRDRRLHRHRAGRGARALPPARLPRPGADRGSGRRDPRRRGPAARPTCSTAAAPTPWRRPSRRTARGRSTRSSTRGSTARSSSGSIEPDPLMRFDTADARTMIGDLVRRVGGR